MESKVDLNKTWYMRCVDGYDGSLTPGKVYECRGSYSTRYYSVLDDSGAWRNWYRYRFAYITESQKDTTEPSKDIIETLIESSMDTQVGGDHYHKLKIQPVEYIQANGLGFIEGSIVKYITRWRDKGGVQDLKKIIQFTSQLIALEEKYKES